MRHGSLCTGYGGIDLALAEVLNAETVWVSDVDKGACKVLAHRFPDVPNIGDMTTVDWSQVEPVDVLSGGTPCQDLSHAGARKGMREGTRSNLWVAMREAIAVLRPSLVVWENVRGAYSASADSDVETGPGLLGPPDGGPTLRALGRVLGDLSDLRYDARWHGLRAADVGAPHGRFRVFVVAYPHGGLEFASSARADQRPVPRSDDGSAVGDGVAALLPTPRTSDTNGAGSHGEGGVDLRTAVSLLPTPRATDGTKGGPNQRGSSGDLMLPSAVQLLPTPLVDDARGSRQSTAPNPRADNDTLSDVNHKGEWGKYADAIQRWESLTRPSPAPTEPGRNGNPRLSPKFCEWLMGLPAGWVTDVPGITRNEALRLCGNGVVPQQCSAALRFLLRLEAA